MAALKRSQAAEEVEEFSDRLSALDAQELNLQALEIIANWREDLTIRLRRADLKLELIGGEDDVALAFEVEEFKRCCKVLGWRP
jgi:hypothetical protein